MKKISHSQSSCKRPLPLTAALVLMSSVLSISAYAQQQADRAPIKLHANRVSVVAPDPRIIQGEYTTAVVQVPIPKGLTKQAIRVLFVKLAPHYTHVDGLVRKYFILSDDKAGGVYLFKTRRQADTFFSPDWYQSVKSAYGADAEVLKFETSVVVDNTGTRKISG